MSNVSSFAAQDVLHIQMAEGEATGHLEVPPDITIEFGTGDECSHADVRARVCSTAVNHGIITTNTTEEVFSETLCRAGRLRGSCLEHCTGSPHGGKWWSIMNLMNEVSRDE